jgi:hypothetical protein
LFESGQREGECGGLKRFLDEAQDNVANFPDTTRALSPRWKISRLCG